MKRIFTIIVTMACLGVFPLFAAKPAKPAKAVHLLILADTKDPRIGANVALDAEHIQEYFSYLASVASFLEGILLDSSDYDLESDFDTSSIILLSKE